MQTHLQIAGALTVLAVAGIVGAVVADYRQGEVEKLIRSELEEQQTVMYGLADITDRNGADENVGSIIRDCERRSEFESLLVKLGSLTKKDMLSLQSLFDACGNFEAERKALMVGKLEREYQEYTDLYMLLSKLTAQNLDAYDTALWKDIVEKERMRSDLLQELSNIQAEIITELIRGESLQGTEVTSIMNRARDVSELLGVYDRKVDESRAAVKP